MEQDITEIKNSLKKLEKKRNPSVWLQFLLFPIVLGIMGYIFQSVIKESENRIEQLKMTQTIMKDIYVDTIYERTVAMRGIMNELLQNDELSEKLAKLIDERVKKLIVEGTPEQVSGIVNAVEAVSNTNDSLKIKIESDTAWKEAQNALKTRTADAKAEERKGFQYLADGNLKSAEISFRKVDSIYPTYHQAYEINRLLAKVNQKGNMNQDQLDAVKLNVIENLNYGAPKDLLQKIEGQVQN